MELLSIDSQRWCAIRQRSAEFCIVFNDQPMPLGTIPQHGRVGVEQRDGEVLLLVDRCTPPSDVGPDIDRWLRTGSAHFDSFEALDLWIRETLTPSYGRMATPSAAPAGQHPDLETADCTGRQRFLDADAVAGDLGLQVIGQTPALRVIAEAAVRHVARVSPRRPLTVLCVGPTGVGKTSASLHLAETLAARTGNDWGFVRLEGAELQESHTVARLFGAPPGYIGYGDATPLADTLRSNQFSIVLVDEIEKAAHTVFRAFLGLLDTGRMTDSRGEINAAHAIFLFTSNLAADGILHDIEAQGSLDDAGLVDRVTRRHLRQHGVLPELVSRITHLAVFSHLDAAIRVAITELSVERVAATYGVEVASIDQSVISTLISDLEDTAYGVRTLEYRVDSILGEALMEAARSGAGQPIRLSSDSDGGCCWMPVDTREGHLDDTQD